MITLRSVLPSYTVRGAFFGMLCLAGLLPAGTSKAQPVPVKIQADAAGAHLQRSGTNLFINGAGGDGSQTLLKELGGNSIRTWGAENAGKILDDAHKLGITVTLGIWLGHKEHGFDYSNADQVAAQYEEARKVILKYKDHPALLMWSIGNEEEGDGNNAAVWSAVNNIAALAKKLDTNHPTMTVVAEIGANKVKNINRLCPDIDIIGINSYGGGPTLAKRYVAAGGVKPYVVTEFGPAGVWEIARNGFDTAEELSSTAKAAAYLATYSNSIQNQPLCLGSYAFAWGWKQEATATWFGLLLPDGSRLGATDVLSKFWTGAPPKYLCPTLNSLKLAGANEVDPGVAIHADLDAVSPSGEALKTTWILQADSQNLNSNGDTQAAPPTYPAAITRSDARSADIKMPATPGIYRLFAYLRDAHGGAAVANVPIHVKGNMAAAVVAKGSAKKAKLPYAVLAKAEGAKAVYVPSGFMGNTGAIKVVANSPEAPHSGKSCMQVRFDANDGWGGVVWQDPANDWGDLPGGLDLTGASKLTFWARGEKGGEKVTFICGLLKSDKPYHDTALTKLEDVSLAKEWTQYTIDLKGRDLSRIKTGFAWTLASHGSPVMFYLDDIVFE